MDILMDRMFWELEIREIGVNYERHNHNIVSSGWEVMSKYMIMAGGEQSL